MRRDTGRKRTDNITIHKQGGEAVITVRMALAWQMLTDAAQGAAEEAEGAFSSDHRQDAEARRDAYQFAANTIDKQRTQPNDTLTQPDGGGEDAANS